MHGSFSAFHSSPQYVIRACNQEKKSKEDSKSYLDDAVSGDKEDDFDDDDDDDDDDAPTEHVDDDVAMSERFVSQHASFLLAASFS